MFDQFRVISTVDHWLSAAGYVRAANLPTGGAADWPAANLAIFVGFKVPMAIQIDRVWFSQVSGTTNIDIGIFDSAGAKIVSTGSTAKSGSITPQVISISDTILSKGFYYFGMSQEVGGAGLGRVGAIGHSVVAAMSSCWSLFQQSSAFPLPSQATFSPSVQTIIPAMGLIRKGY